MKINLNIINPLSTKKYNAEKQALAINQTKTDVFEKTSNVNFSGIHVAPANFKIKDIEYLHCPICGRLMLNEKQQKEFIKKVANAKGIDLFLALDEYKSEYTLNANYTKNQIKKDISIYHGKKNDVVNILQDLALANPKLSISGLVELQAKASLTDLIENQMEVVNELKEYIKNSNFKKDELHKIHLIINKYVQQIKGKSAERFKRKNFINDLKNVTSETKKQKQIDRIITKLPTSNSSIHSFFVKYSDKKRSNEEIASKLILDSLPTCEHLIPRSKGGKDVLENYLCDCAECNSSRGDTDFYIWQKHTPHMQKNLQEHLRELKIKTTEKQLPKMYHDYSKTLADTILILSMGEIHLIPPKK